MARLVFLKNPLSFQRREEHELAPGRSVIDWLLEHHPPPNGCDGALRWYINGEEQTDAEGKPDLSNLDYVPEADDVVILAASPGYGIGEGIITGIIVAIIVAAISITVQLLFFNKKPSTPPGFQRGDDQPNPVYDTRAQGNVARLGEPIPVVYGTVLMTPDHAMQPHRWYANNESYLDQLFVLSQGEVDVHEVLLGDTPAQMVEGGAFTYAIVPPWQHQSQPFRLGFYSDFYENVITSPEIQGIEFTGVQSSGYFRLSKTGLTGRTIMIDLAWPAGIFFQASFGGNQSPSTVSFAIHISECDAAGNVIGTPQVHYFSQNAQTNDPIRRTIYIDPGYDSLWAVKVERFTPQAQETTDLFHWVGAKMMATPQAPMYGDVTLLAVRVRATAGLGEGNTLVRARITRKLPPLGSGTLVATQNPADALVDIYTNAIYGARRPLYEVDVPKLAQLRAAWANYQFSAVYVSRVTVWEALTHAVQGMGAAPLPVGSFMTVAQDGIKSARSMLFTEQNIVRDTFALSYEFDRPGANDGIEIEYRDAASFSPTYLRIPSNSVDPEKVALIGCVDPRHAEGYAQYLWNKKRFPRQTIEFETELEGLIPYVGERVAISHTLPRWGVSGFVSKLEGLTVWLDRELPWDETPYPYMMFRTSTSGASAPVAVRPGPAANIVIMGAMPMADWHIGDRMENTHFVFGNAETVVRDFILADIRPRGGVKVGISGVIYQPEMYPGTLDFMNSPVP